LKGYQKKQNLALISKMCRSLEFSKREIIFAEKLIFQALRKFCKKNVFLAKNLRELLDAKDLHIFEISPFFNSFKGRCYFLEVKKLNKIETSQYLKKTFLQTSLRISLPNQIHMKQRDLGKSLDPNAGGVGVPSYLVSFSSVVSGPLPSANQ
jgi:hypothetical protein